MRFNSFCEPLASCRDATLRSRNAARISQQPQVQNENERVLTLRKHFPVCKIPAKRVATGHFPIASLFWKLQESQGSCTNVVRNWNLEAHVYLAFQLATLNMYVKHGPENVSKRICALAVSMRCLKLLYRQLRFEQIFCCGRLRRGCVIGSRPVTSNREVQGGLSLYF